MFHNMYSRAIKKQVYELVKDKYTENIDEIIERIGGSMATEKDLHKLIELFSVLYQAGYQSAYSAAEEAMKKRGFKLKKM